MENGYNKVKLGQILHEESYKKENLKDILIDNIIISIDIADSVNIREVKYFDKMAEADKIQLLYYLFYLKKFDIEKEGVINYPRQRKRECIKLTKEYEE
jgi:CRISPR-associated exonuclease Cas4